MVQIKIFFFIWPVIFEKCPELNFVESMEVEGRNCIKPETEFFPFLFFFQKFWHKGDKQEPARNRRRPVFEVHSVLQFCLLPAYITCFHNKTHNGPNEIYVVFLIPLFCRFFQPTCPARFTPDQLLYLLKMKKTCCLYTLELYKLFSIEISKKDGQKSCNRFSFKS